MRYKLAMLLIGAIPYMALAESIKYSYDDSGNRIWRQIVITSRSSDEDSNDIEDMCPPECFSEVLSEKDIRLHTDPMNGILKIEIADYDKSDCCSLRIFTVSGQQVLSTYVNSSWTEFDIRSWSKEIHILHISINGNDTFWKIVKN